MGHRFRIFGVDFYRCLGNGEVTAGVGKTGSNCPSCGRYCLNVSAAALVAVKIDCDGLGLVTLGPGPEQKRIPTREDELSLVSQTVVHVSRDKPRSSASLTFYEGSGNVPEQLKTLTDFLDRGFHITNVDVIQSADSTDEVKGEPNSDLS